MRLFFKCYASFFKIIFMKGEGGCQFVKNSNRNRRRSGRYLVMNGPHRSPNIRNTFPSSAYGIVSRVRCGAVGARKRTTETTMYRNRIRRQLPVRGYWIGGGGGEIIQTRANVLRDRTYGGTRAFRSGLYVHANIPVQVRYYSCCYYYYYRSVRVRLMDFRVRNGVQEMRIERFVPRVTSNAVADR